MVSLFDAFYALVLRDRRRCWYVLSAGFLICVVMVIVVGWAAREIAGPLAEVEDVW